MEYLLIGSGTTRALTAFMPATCFVCEADSVLQLPRNTTLFLTPILGSVAIVRGVRHETIRRGEVYVADGIDAIDCAVDRRGLSVAFVGERHEWQGEPFHASLALGCGLHHTPGIARRLIAIARACHQPAAARRRSHAIAWQDTPKTLAGASNYRADGLATHIVFRSRAGGPFDRRRS